MLRNHKLLLLLLLKLVIVIVESILVGISETAICQSETILLLMIVIASLRSQIIRLNIHYADRFLLVADWRLYHIEVWNKVLRCPHLLVVLR